MRFMKFTVGKEDLFERRGRETEKGSDPPSAILECLQQLGLSQAEVQGLEQCE